MKILDKFVVDQNKHIFSFNFWELVGIPCRHARATISYIGHDHKKYVHNYYSKGQSRWPKTNYEEILPPLYKKGLGRPKKFRKKKPYEEPNLTKLRRGYTPYKSDRCHEYGHNGGNERTL